MYMFSSGTLGPDLRRLRDARGLTQAALAERAGLSRIFIAKVEAGDRLPSWPTFDRLARLLGARVEVRLVRQRRAGG